jgi:4-hydroxybenzoate polyprenyltransferase
VGDRLAALRVVHPFPSILNAALVAALATVAGGTVPQVVTLAVGMLGLQFCIGAVNDLVDEPDDARTRPTKPIPRGLVRRRTAVIVALVSGGGGMILAASLGVEVEAMATAMLAAGLAYDLVLKPTPFAWLCYSIAFPILPVYAWYGAVGTLPPRWDVLLPVAALAGPALQLANGLVDLEGDRTAGLVTLATRLGRGRGLGVMALLLAAIHGLAWLTLAAGAPALALAAVLLAGTLCVAGVFLTSRAAMAAREAGWQAQAVAIALLGAGWLAAARL